MNKHCSGPGCEEKRSNWSNPDVSRGIQVIEVPEGYEGPAFCSVECSMYYKAAQYLQEGIDALTQGKRVPVEEVFQNLREKLDKSN